MEEIFMGLFKEFKDDFSQAVNELVPGDVPEKEVEPKAQTADNLVVDTIGENVDVASELSKLDGLLEHRRKTCFPTVGGAIATKAKPSEDSTVFCIYLIFMATIPNLI